MVNTVYSAELVEAFARSTFTQPDSSALGTTALPADLQPPNQCNTALSTTDAEERLGSGLLLWVTVAGLVRS